MTSRRCSKAPAVNQDCSNHLVNIMRTTVCLCDQGLCNGLFALTNFTTPMNSRIFTNNNMLLTSNTANKLNSLSTGIQHSANSNSFINKIGSSSMISNQISIQNPRNKENFMPLHDFNEQRIAAMLGEASQLKNTFFAKALILSNLVMLCMIFFQNLINI